jgi:nitrogen-specific signal transduction histidine kinase
MRPEVFTALLGILLKNAQEWKRPDVHLHVQFDVRTVADCVEILVSDNGRGVAPTLASSLFEPSVSGRDDAPGLGLTLARDLLAAHQGAISLLGEGRLGGATFCIRVPRKRPRATVHESSGRAQGST